MPPSHLALALVAALAFAGAPTRATAESSRCRAGAFVVEGAPLLPDSSLEGSDEIGLEEGELWFESGCGRREAVLHDDADGTRVRARFFRRAPAGAGSFGGGSSFHAAVATFSWNVLQGLVGGGGGARCGSARFVRLRATIDADCQTMTGVLSAKSPRLRREFVARTAPIPVCDATHPCPAGDLCELPAGQCASALDAGACVHVPEVCPDVYDPVCGCDGVTYGNDCERRAARVQKSAEGACSGVCGTIAGIACPDGRFCEFATDQCEGADLAGECVEIAEACTLHWDPVCGCDGVTYGNECERRAAAVSKHHDGACEEGGGTLSAGLP